MNNNEFDNKKLKNVLLKKALGYTEEEISEEFSVVDGEIQLTKRKVNTKKHPPDLNAIQLILNTYSDEHKEWDNISDEELKNEKIRLLKMLKELDEK